MNKEQLFEQIDNNEIQAVFETLGKNKAIFSGFQDLQDRYIFDNPKGVDLLHFKGALKAFISSKLAGEDDKAASRKGSPYYLTPIAATVPANFLGREKELTDIRNLITRQNTIALVNAEGGMGKTTLAARYWQQYQHDYKNLAWLFCENGILAAMRSQLPEALHLTDAMNQYAADVEQQTRVIKTAMTNLEKDCLLVLDNANEPDHISGFLHYMTGLGWHVLITSRCSKVLPDAGSEYKITGLPPEKARKLFKQYHDEKTAEFDALLDRFLKAVGYNTLCIEIFSKNLGGSAGWGATLETLLEKIEKNGLFLGDESFEIIADWTHSTQKVAVKSTDQVVEALYDIAGLQQNNPDLHDLLITFALLPAESHSPAVLIPLLAPEDKKGLRRRLDQLTQKGWLSTDNTTYRISPVVQKILLHRHAERLWELGEPVVTRLRDIFQSDGYHPNDIVTAMPFADLAFGLADHLNTSNEDIAILFNRLWVYQNATGNLAKAMDAAEKLQEICEKNDDKNGLSISFQFLGETHTSMGNLNKSLFFFEKYHDIRKELYETNSTNVDFKNGLAISYAKLGSTHSALGNLDKALFFFENYHDIRKELYETNSTNVGFKNGLAISYAKLGSTHSALGNLDKALTFFERYYNMSNELYESNPTNVGFKSGLAISYSKLGETHFALGNLDKALAFFENYNRLEKELYKANPNNVSFKNDLAISYLNLGDFATLQLNDQNKALAYFQQAESLWVELVRDAPQYAMFQRYLSIAREILSEL